MGAIGGVVRLAGSVCDQPAAFHASIEQSVLGQPDLLPEPRGVLAQSGDGHHALRLSAVFAGRPASLDHWPGTDGIGHGGEDEILAGLHLFVDRDAEPDHVFLLLPENAVGSDRFFWRGGHDHDVRAEWLGAWPGSFVSKLQGSESEQNRQRFWRDALPRAEFPLYFGFRIGAGLWDNRLASADQLCPGQRRDLHRVILRDRMAAAQAGVPAIAEVRILSITL